MLINQQYSTSKKGKRKFTFFAYEAAPESAKVVSIVCDETMEMLEKRLDL